MIRARLNILFVDNFAAHLSSEFSNVSVVFLPPNMTSVLQPMDTGVIKCLKEYFRIELARKLIHFV